MRFFDEILRRNVIRVGLAYAAGSWLLIQIVETVFPAFGFGDAAIRNLVIVLGIGLIPVLVFAWVFELTPEGLKLERDVDRSKSITRDTGRRLDRVVISILAIALCFLALDRFILDPGRDAELLEAAREQGRIEALTAPEATPSIAVLPFADMSPEGDRAYFSDGLAEELLNLLARVPGLRVTSRTSSFSFADRSLDLPSIADALNVTYILEGSVRWSGDSLRVTAQLIDARNDAHLWSRVYERQMVDIFVLQDEIAASVLESLTLTLAGDLPRAIETDPAAYSMYLQARHLWRQGTEEGAAAALSLLEQIVEIDPDYAPAWDALSTVYTYQVEFGQLDFEDGYDKARDAALRALQIDADFAAALAHMGYDAMMVRQDLPAAAEYFRSALDSEPNNPTTLGNVATFAAILGRQDEAGRYMQAAIDIDPIDSAKYTNLGAFHLAAGRLDDAEKALQRALELSPGDYWTQLATVYLRILQGRAGEALSLSDSFEFGQMRLQAMPMIHAALGDDAERDAALAELEAALGNGITAFDIAEVHARLRDADQAFEWLNRAIDDGQDVSLIRVSPFMPALHQDPRWQPALARIGLADAQIAQIVL